MGLAGLTKIPTATFPGAPEDLHPQPLGSSTPPPPTPSRLREQAQPGVIFAATQRLPGAARLGLQATAGPPSHRVGDNGGLQGPACGGTEHWTSIVAPGWTVHLGPCPRATGDGGGWGSASSGQNRTAPSRDCLGPCWLHQVQQEKGSLPPSQVSPSSSCRGGSGQPWSTGNPKSP